MKLKLRSAAADLHNMSSRDAHDVHKALMMASDASKDATVFNLSKGLLIDFTLSGVHHAHVLQHWTGWQSGLCQDLLTIPGSATTCNSHLIRGPLLQLASSHRTSP